MKTSHTEFAKGLLAVLREDGQMVTAGGEVYIRSLEGEILCVGELDDEGGLANEVEFVNDYESAIERYIEMITSRNLW